MCLVCEIYGICGPESKGSMSIILLLYKMSGQDQDVDVKFNFQKGLILKQYWPSQNSKLTVKN